MVRPNRLWTRNDIQDDGLSPDFEVFLNYCTDSPEFNRRPEFVRRFYRRRDLQSTRY